MISLKVLYGFGGMCVAMLLAYLVYALRRLHVSLPLNPAGMAAVSPDSAFNTAISFVTNTNWQGYAGESTMNFNAYGTLIDD